MLLLNARFLHLNVIFFIRQSICNNSFNSFNSFLLSIYQAERELRVAQSEFDRQSEITKLLLEGVGSTQSTHLRYLHAFVESQVRYFAQCNKIMHDLQSDLAR